AMGRFHQHSRTDRNSYITVNYDNIDADCQSQYSVNGGTNYVEYDFDSLMHYGQWDCSIGGQTMTCKPGYEGWQNQMGQRSHLSSGDIGTVSTRHRSPDDEEARGHAQVQRPVHRGRLETELRGEVLQGTVRDDGVLRGLRLQQVALDGLRASDLPDRVAEGALPY
ncbi:MAG TPA: hypothetical protein EYP98_19635, partial [Planctomycetes bacterium]|nr:hypothetical protein [Planctomycetota bacterium]